ncbi:MAG: hypothetical protein ACK4PH_26075, partial [Aquincola tertiaricarbonis]
MYGRTIAFIPWRPQRLEAPARSGYLPAHDRLSELGMNGDAPLQRVRVWDLPTRVFHWLLAA